MLRDPVSPYQSARRRQTHLHVLDGNAAAKPRQETSSVGRNAHSLGRDVAYVRGEEWPGDRDVVFPSGCCYSLTIDLTVLGAMAIHLVPAV